MFPAAAALGWGVLIYIGVILDSGQGVRHVVGHRTHLARFGRSDPCRDPAVFLFAYLNLNRWHVRYAHITVGWLAFLGALVAVALFSLPVASVSPACRCFLSRCSASRSSFIFPLRF